MNIKKIITYALITVLLVAGLFALTGCGAKTETETVKTGIKESILIDNDYNNDGSVLALDVYYPENAGIEVEEEYTGCKVFTDKEDNYEITIRFKADSTYTDNKKSDSERYKDSYKEFKIGEYNAYSYEGHKCITIVPVFEEMNEHEIRHAVIEIDVVSQAGNEDSGIDFFANNEEVKSIINSLTYSGAVPAPSEVTE